MTVPHAFGSELFDWVGCIIDHPIRMQDGFAYPHAEPALGFRIKDGALAAL